ADEERDGYVLLFCCGDPELYRSSCPRGKGDERTGFCFGSCGCCGSSGCGCCCTCRGNCATACSQDSSGPAGSRSHLAGTRTDACFAYTGKDIGEGSRAADGDQPGLLHLCQHGSECTGARSQSFRICLAWLSQPGEERADPQTQCAFDLRFQPELAREKDVCDRRTAPEAALSDLCGARSEQRG